MHNYVVSFSVELRPSVVSRNGFERQDFQLAGPESRATKSIWGQNHLIIEYRSSNTDRHNLCQRLCGATQVDAKNLCVQRCSILGNIFIYSNRLFWTEVSHS